MRALIGAIMAVPTSSSATGLVVTSVSDLARGAATSASSLVATSASGLVLTNAMAMTATGDAVAGPDEGWVARRLRDREIPLALRST